MNDQLKQIAFEAGQGGHSWYNDPNCLAKFAQLIVQECIDTAFHKGHPDLEFLLKHFGVEL